MIGQDIGRYRILSKLGEGGMGEVYLALDTTLDRKVALKFLPEALSKAPDARERLLREAKAASKLNHSNIVTVHAVEREGERDFIAMEFVDGRPLDAFLSEKPRTTDELLRIAIQIARGLEHAHQAGIIHRDLKPANIFIDRDDRVRILDFGLASLPGARKLTQTGSTVGTIAYMSPEQVQGQEADDRSDLFTFGIVLFEMLAGRAPFGGEHHAAVMYSILNDSPAPVSQFRADVPPGVEALVARALEKDPSHRYQSARDLLADLRRLREGSGPSRVHPAVTPLPKRRRLPKAVLPALIVTAGAVVLLVLQPWKVEVTPVQEARALDNRLAVMYFDNLADPADGAKLGEIAANLLITNLTELRHIQVVSSQRLYDILKSLGREGEKHLDRGMASQVAERAQAKWMLMGSILQMEPGFIVTSQIVELPSGNAIASQRAAGESGESIFAIVDRLTQEIREDPALPAAATPVRPVADVTTQSADAYRYYLEGVENLNKLYYPEAEAAFRRAIAIDSGFALSYVQLIFMGRGSRAEQEAWTRTVTGLADKVGEKDRRLIEMTELVRNATIEQSVEKLQEFTRDFPEEKMALRRLAVFLRRLGRYEESLDVTHRLIAMDSLDAPAYNQMAYTYHSLKDFDNSITAVNKYIELVPDEANPYDSRGDLYAYQGRLEDAKRSYRRALEINPGFYHALTKLGDMNVMTGNYARAESCYTVLAAMADREARATGREGFAISLAYQGRLREAIAAAEAGIAADDMEQYDRGLRISKEVLRAFCHDGLGEYERALRVATEVVRMVAEREPWNPVQWRGLAAYYFDRSGSTESADSVLEDMRRRIVESDSTLLKDYWATKAIVELGRGNPARARELYRHVPERNLGFHDHYFLAQIHLGLNEPGEAIAHLESEVGAYSEEAFIDAPRRVKIHYLLGQAYEQSGWTKKAIEQYQKFLDVWSRPDSGIVELDDARARLRALRGQPG